MKPRILLSANTNSRYYIEAVENCGGVPVTVYCPSAWEGFDGLILCGGNDVDPKYYEEPFNGAVDIDEKRDAAEMKLIQKFLDAGKPILGICRGHQILNVFFGGSLVQHLPNTDEHRNGKDFYITHTIRAEKDSIVGQMYGTKFTVNSSHHQAIKRPGKELRVTAWAEDVPEAFEHKTLNVFGVQWHPERMSFGQRREDTVDGAEIFRYFLQLCRSVSQK